MVVIAIASGSIVLVLLSAPLWAPHLGLALPPPPPAGLRVPLANGHHINLFDEGSGPPVVLVHGLPGSAHDWRPLPEQLVSAGFRVIRYDRVGYGHSSRRRAGESHGIDANAAELLQLLAALRLDRPLVIGWSYGGAVAQYAAMQGSSSMAGLMLVAADGPGNRPSRAFATLFASTHPLRAWAIAAGFPARFGVARLGPQAFQGTVPAWWPEHAVTVISPAGVGRTWTREVSDFDPTAIRPAGIRVPVTLIHGSKDTTVPPAVAEALHREIQSSVLVPVIGGGHMLPNTHAPVIVDELSKLIARIARPRPTS